MRLVAVVGKLMVVAEVDNVVEISSCVNEVDDCGVVDDGCMVLCCSTIL